MAPFDILAADGRFYGALDPAQDLAAGIADRCSQRVDGSRGGKVVDRVEIFPVKPALRFQPAPFQQKIGDADGRGAFELQLQADLIIPFQKRTVNDVEQVPAVVVPAAVDHPACNIRKLLGKIRVGNTVLCG